MAQFPKLRTGAVAQYPITRETRLRNQSVRFVDGSIQRYRDSGTIRRQWVIRLEMLDEGEMAAVEDFFTAMQGGYTAFTFQDPWDGAEYDNCRLGDEAAFVVSGELQGSTTLTVTQ